MPTPRTMDDVPITPVVASSGGEKVSTLTYLEARLRDQREHGMSELHALKEMLLRFRDDTHSLRESMLEDIARRLDERDLRYQQRFDAQSLALNAAMLAAEKAINAALTSAAAAVQKAEAASETRFQSVNEFRSQLADQTRSFIPRVESAARFDSLAEKLDALSSRLDRSEGSSGGTSKSWVILLGAIGAIGTLFGIVVLLMKGT